MTMQKSIAHAEARLQEARERAGHVSTSARPARDLELEDAEDAVARAEASLRGMVLTDALTAYRQARIAEISNT